MVSLNAVSMGYDTVVLEHAYRNIKRWNKIGKYAYPLAVIQTLTHKKSYKLRYDFENDHGDKHSGEIDAILSVVANGRFYGGGFNPAPDAKLNDGLGDFLIADRLNLFELIPLIFKYRDGKHIGHKKIHHFNFTRGSIETIDSNEIKANVDGRIFTANKMEFEMLTDALNFAQIKEY